MHKFSTAFPQLFNSATLTRLTALGVTLFLGIARAHGQAWTWDRVQTDVSCGPELMGEYRVWVAELVPVPYSCTLQSCDENGENCQDVPGTCMGYFQSPWQLGTTVPDPGAGAVVTTPWDVPTPELGAVFWVTVQAVDAAGNVETAAACTPPPGP